MVHFDLHDDLLHRAAVRFLAARPALHLRNVLGSDLALGAGLRRGAGIFDSQRTPDPRRDDRRGFNFGGDWGDFGE